jgi:hypothetical protein
VVAPFVELFESLQAGLDALGFVDVDEVYGFVLGGWLSWDKNGDSLVCTQDMPDTNGHPAFIFNFHG